MSETQRKPARYGSMVIESLRYATRPARSSPSNASEFKVRNARYNILIKVINARGKGI